MTVYFKSLPILNSPSRTRGVASSTQPLNVNVGIVGVATRPPCRAPSARVPLVLRAALGVGIALAILPDCTRAEPPAPDGTPWRAEPELVPPNAATAGPLVPTPSSSSTGPRVTALLVPTPSSSADPATLPQTHDVPAASGAAFDTRVRALWTAIVSDDPEAAMPFFFPLGAYRQVKDVADPEADWKRRLVSAYKRDVHALHARLGDGAAHATLVSLDVPSAASRWVDPGEEWNKLGYYRVFGSKLRYSVDGRAGSFDVKSLISWRGEWYVVHLSAIR